MIGIMGIRPQNWDDANKRECMAAFELAKARIDRSHIRPQYNFLPITIDFYNNVVYSLDIYLYPITTICNGLHFCEEEETLKCVLSMMEVSLQVIYISKTEMQFITKTCDSFYFCTKVNSLHLKKQTTFYDLGDVSLNYVCAMVLGGK